VARFRYIGAPAFSEADELPYFGTTFYRGEVSEVTEPLYIAKLKTMPAFEQVEDDAPLSEKAYEALHGRKKPGRKPKPKIDLSDEPKDEDEDEDEDEDDGEDELGTDNPGAPTFERGGGWSGPKR
jgi:hypothetical protein